MSVNNFPLLTQLPAPSGSHPQVSSGWVVLYKDNKWTSQSCAFNIADYLQGQRQRIPSYMNDQATWLVWNLPPGTVMTLMKDDPGNSGSNPISATNLSYCGATIDLVGTGDTWAADLTQLSLNDCLTSFFWRTVDWNYGAIELFDDINFSGNRVILFLSEWPSGTIHDLGHFWINDKISSVRWKTMTDRQTAVLFQNSDGSGNQYNNINGYGNIKEIAKLGDYGFNDQLSAFRWDGVVPVKEVIDPIIVVPTSGSGSKSYSQVVKGQNGFNINQSAVVTVNQTDAETLTVTTTDTFVTGTTVTMTNSISVGVKDVDLVTASYAIAINFSYTSSKTVTRTSTVTSSLTIAQTVTCPPLCTYIASLIVTMGTVAPATYKTKATRWYSVPVHGAVIDSTNNYWYKRVEDVAVSLEGTLASTAVVTCTKTGDLSPTPTV